MFEDLVEFAQEASADANHPVFSFDALCSIRKGLERDTSQKPSTKQIHPNPDRRRTRSVALSTNSNEARKPNPSQSAPEERKCALCAGSHDLDRCEEFLQKSVDEREQVCKQRGVCFSCLRRGHRVRECQRKGQCNVCKKTHATLLHRPHTQEKRESETREQATSNCVSVCLTSECNRTTTSMILPVWLYHRSKPEAAVQVYAVLDDQSDTCFITEETRKSLGLEGPEIPLELGTMHSVETVSTQRLEGLVISSYDKGEDIELPKTYSRDQIPSHREQIPRPETALKYKHLASIADDITPYQENLKVGLLIGNNCVRAIKPRSLVPGKPSEPYAIRTALGWGVIGAPGGRDNSDDNDTAPHANCHRIATREIANDSQLPTRFVTPETYKEVMTPHAILRMFEQDFSERQAHENREMSQEDKRFIEITTSGMHKTDDGHYEMPLPFRDQRIDMPCNRKLAETRLEQLKKRFSKDPKYKKDYVAFVEKMLEEGHAEKGSVRAQEGVVYSPSWSLPSQETRENTSSFRLFG